MQAQPQPAAVPGSPSAALAVRPAQCRHLRSSLAAAPCEPTAGPWHPNPMSARDAALLTLGPCPAAPPARDASRSAPRSESRLWASQLTRAAPTRGSALLGSLRVFLPLSAVAWAPETSGEPASSQLPGGLLLEKLRGMPPLKFPDKFLGAWGLARCSLRGGPGRGTST